MNRKTKKGLALSTVLAITLLTGFSRVDAAGVRLQDGSCVNGGCEVASGQMLRGGQGRQGRSVQDEQDPNEQRVRWGQMVRRGLRDGRCNEDCPFNETGERQFLNQGEGGNGQRLRDGSGSEDCQYNETGERQFLNQGEGGNGQRLRDGSGSEDCPYNETGERQFLNQGTGARRGRNR